MRLLIYIPTYERLESLTEQVGRLVPQLTSEVHLLVNDNCSTSYSIYDLRAKFHDAFEARRNSGNIHGNANILLGFIFANEYDYLWILSDNDLVSPACLPLILGELRHDPDYLVLVPGLTAPTQETVEYKDGWFVRTGVMGLISAGIYRVAAVSSQIHQGFYYHNSSFPHLAVILGQLQEHGSARIRCLPQAQTLVSEFEVKQANYIYSAIGLPQLYSLIHPKKQLEFLSRWLFENHIPYFVGRNQFPDSWRLTRAIVRRFPALWFPFGWFGLLGLFRRNARRVRSWLVARWE